MVAILNDRLGLPKRSVFKDLQVMRVGGKIAVRYKGRLFTNLSNSPVLTKLLAMPDVEKKMSDQIFGPSPPNLFVGEYGYPNVFVGPLVSVDEGSDAQLLDSPVRWTGLSYEQVIQMRVNLVRGKRLHCVHGQSRYLDEVQDAVLSRTAVDLEVYFAEKPRFGLVFSTQSQPMGPSGLVKSFSLADNPSVPGVVDEVIEEKMLVREAVPELLQHGLDYYYVQKLLSAGVLGRERKLVPTKWSITGSDDIIAKHLLSDVRGFPEVSDYLLFSNEFMFNHFEVLLMPGKWEFENFESWEPSTPWAEQAPGIIEEHEPFEGRSHYAELQGGGYYASRIAVVEALHAMRRQARCIVFREVNSGYQVPAGVWQVRENVRAAVKKQPLACSSLSDALEVLGTRLKSPVQEYVSRSRILAQKRMSAWM